MPRACIPFIMIFKELRDVMSWLGLESVVISPPSRGGPFFVSGADLAVKLDQYS